VVANKYLTGFDQPKLTTMYVDKKLSGVLCVQALSRLNRAAPKYNKRTEDLFILDFFNDIKDIKTAFDDFYTSTTLSKATDVNVLHDIKTALDDTGVYERHEVIQLNDLFLKMLQPKKLALLLIPLQNGLIPHLSLPMNKKLTLR
jgi:type I restriction enzyme R subunit